MTWIQEGYLEIQRAEESIRALMRKAIEEQSYREVATLASLAESLAELAASDGPDSRIVGEGNETARYVAGAASAGRAAPAARNVRKRGPYPRFEREDGKLVKVGWSKRNRSEYEHKAPREAVEAFCSSLAQHAAGRETFTMDELLPATSSGGDLIPDYQAYLALAWLRHEGQVRKAGRDGYELVGQELPMGHFDDWWNEVPDRG